MTATIRRWPVLLAALLAFLALAGLGTWQFQRLQWKEALLASIEERTHRPPAPLSDIEAHYQVEHDVDYEPVTLTGTFRHESERHFFATWQGDTGYYVYTPLELADGRFVFVNRGFVPYELKDAAKRPQGQTQGQVMVDGLARNALADKPGRFVPDNDAARDIFYWKDLAAMTASAGLPDGATVLPFFVDAGNAPNAGGLPVGGVTLIDLPNNHLQYALTWYGLAAALVGVVVVWLRKPGDGARR